VRILHIDSGREMRGGQWQVLRLVEGLGAGNTLLAPDGTPLMREAEARGIDVRPLTITAIATLSRRSDLTHAHDARSHTWAAAFAARPLVVSRRVTFPPGRSFLSRWKYGVPDLFLAVSEHVKLTLKEAEVPEERIEVVYDGVPIPDREARPEFILAPATDDPMKGAGLTREAAALRGYDVRFSTDLEHDMPRAAVLVYITRSEGLGSAALLAMSYGVPVVASRVGGLPEAVEEDVTGKLTDNEPRSICDAIAAVLANRDCLGRNARQRVIERFSTAAMVDRTQHAYRRVLGC
jgi:hypothetical protein